jgi:F-type H+/Na+-transporting ATPase subunit alpha
MNTSPLIQAVDEVARELVGALEDAPGTLRLRDRGIVRYVGRGIAVVDGLAGVGSEELVSFEGGALGLAFNLDPDSVGIVLLDDADRVETGFVAHATGRVVGIPVGEELLGRVVDALGRPLDGGRTPRHVARLDVEQPAAPIMDRAAVEVPLQTGMKAIDALVPIGRGQRELILGDRQTGKTAIAVDTMLAQLGGDVVCVYCAIGQRSSAVANVIERLRAHGALEYSCVVSASGDGPPGMRFLAPYAATAIGEHFMRQGRDVLVVYDDLTKHAQSYRELSLLLRRPPGREAYPGDIFYLHSRLLERSTHLVPERGGGSLTALPIAETEAGDISAYIPTNLISITDGQIYLSPELFNKGIMPAVDVGRSVSRVGGAAQLGCYRAVGGHLKLAFAQFEELETFSRFGVRLDERTRRALRNGRRVREVLKQPQATPLPVIDQVPVLVAVVEGLLDDVGLHRIAEAQELLIAGIHKRIPDLAALITCGKPFSEDAHANLVRVAEEIIAPLRAEDIDAEEALDASD